MRLSFLILLLIAILFGSGYWYRAFDGVCDVPIRYRIGEIDERFGTDKEELRRIAERAEKLWEDKISQDLFVYDESAKFPINLVFDERQENADIEEELKEDLEAKQGMSDQVGKQYDALIAEFRKIKKNYESRVFSYETKLDSYNETVTEWNDKGGVPESAMGELKEKEGELKREQGELEALAKKLNQLVAELNAIGARGNTLITKYNTVVEEYNNRVSETGEFTQGDYTQNAITVYQFNSEDELTIVLGHEFGHALSLGHVQNEKSIMFHLMGAQRVENGVSDEDTAEFARVCNQGGVLVKMLRFLSGLV